MHMERLLKPLKNRLQEFQQLQAHQKIWMEKLKVWFMMFHDSTNLFTLDRPIARLWMRLKLPPAVTKSVVTMAKA